MADAGRLWLGFWLGLGLGRRWLGKTSTFCAAGEVATALTYRLISSNVQIREPTCYLQRTDESPMQPAYSYDLSKPAARFVYT